MNFIIGGMLSLSVLTSIYPQKIEKVAPPLPEVIEVVEIPVELSVQEKIAKYASDYGVDASTMLRIADAESNFENVCNYLYTGETGKYTACGIFQILKSTWKSYCDENNQYENRMNEDKNIECAMKIASKSGYHHWNESKTNWD